MKIKDLYEDFLEYRAKEGNCLKTLTEQRRFLDGPIYNAVGERKLKDTSLLWRADLIEAGTRYGIYGSQRTVVYFRQLLQYARIAGYDVPVDWRDFKTPKVPAKKVVYLAPEELEMVRACFPINKLEGLRTRCLIEFLLGTGLRIGEACSVNIDHINFTTKELWFVNIKTKEEETMYLNDNVIEWILAYLKARELDAVKRGRKDECPALFLSGRERMLPQSSKGYIREKTKHLTLNKKIAHHIFRRTCCTYLLQDKVDIKAVQSYLRHKSERTTLRYYAGVRMDSNKEVARKIMGKYVSRPELVGV